MSTQKVLIPDIGGAESVDVIELCVQPGDLVEKEDSLLVLESDKATMEIPSPFSGKVLSFSVQVGDKVDEGSVVAELEVSEALAEVTTVESDVQSAGDKDDVGAESKPEISNSDSAAANVKSVEVITVPDLGGIEDVPIIELCAQEGEELEAEASLLVLESDKATMEVPAPSAGTFLRYLVAIGDKVSFGTPIAEMKISSDSQSPALSVSNTKSSESKTASSEPETSSTPASLSTHSEFVKRSVEPIAQSNPLQTTPSRKVHAGPAVRRLARELGIDLAQVKASGPRERVLKDDVKAYVKEQLSQKQKDAGVFNLPAVPTIDFSKFGEVERVKMSRLRQIAANNLHRSWVTVPHVTQFDEADITDLETFRKFQKKFAEEKNIKLTILPFLIKAIASALKQFPNFNVSLEPQGEYLVQKKYVHIGFAVDTPQGLLVPVIRDVDKKGVWDLAEEAAQLAAKAQASKLTPAEMQGGCFTISSLGSIGGTAFTPIVNVPEVAILGVSKVQVKPIYQDEAWVPRKMLPLSLSYDHRAINGAEAARFTSYLADILRDMRQALM